MTADRQWVPGRRPTHATAWHGMQETAALMLENLALSEAGKGPLRAHVGVMAGLRALKAEAMSEQGAT